MEDTENDFLVMTSEEVQACCWPAQETEAKRQEEHVAVQATIKGKVSFFMSGVKSNSSRQVTPLSVLS